MASPGNTTTKLQHWLDLMRNGDDHARTELIGHACERLRLLTRRMLRGYPLVRRWEQTDDVLQNAMLRLFRALADVTPDSLRHFYNLAALQIRRELLDLAKHHARSGDGEMQGAEPADEDGEPSSLAEWSEFHQPGRIACPMMSGKSSPWSGITNLSQTEVADVLGVSVRTVIRRWQAARIRLQQGWGGKMMNTTDDKLWDLLATWEEKYRQGQDIPAEELCRDCPELTEEVLPASHP